MQLRVRLRLRLRLVSSDFALLEGASRSPSSDFVFCKLAIKMACVLSSSWSSCCPSSSSSDPHHPLHPPCSRLIPWCHVPCAVHLCRLAQETWRSSSCCGGVLLGLEYTQVQSSPPLSSSWKYTSPREANRGPWWALSALCSASVLRSTSCLAGEWGVHVLKTRATNSTPESYRQNLINACSLYSESLVCQLNGYSHL